MGRPGARSLIALTALVGVLAALPGRAGDAAERCAPAAARIVSIQGLVEVQPADTTQWVPARLDDELCIGDTIRIGELARAALALANDSVLRFDQRTMLRLAGEPESGRSLLDLLFGDVHFFSHRPRALEVDTPIANASTEGTEFLVRARPERTEVVMLAGRVRLASADGEVLLASGDAGLAVAGEAPRREIVAHPRDAVAWTLYYPPILAPLAAGVAPPALPSGLQRAIERVAVNDDAGALTALDAVPDAARDPRYFTYRAGVLLNVGRVDEAADAIERALALEPDAADALAERAVIAVVQDRREQALADARRAIDLAPESAPARIALSYALQATFDLEGARAVLREAAAVTPDNPLVQARLAEILLSFGELDAAEAAAERAVALAPALARTQMVLGFAALTRIDIDQAKEAFHRAIELDSAEPLARLGLGLAKIRAGDLEDGSRELEIAAALDPNDSLLRSYLGKAYFEEKRGPLDAEQFAIAKELDPNDPTPWFYDAIRLQTENRPVEALRNLEKSIDLNDNRAVYRSRLLLDEDLAVRETSLARIYDNLGFEQAALVEATKSLNQDPANYSAHRFLSDTFAGLPRHEIARASELLQSQLLQPININPVQPSLPISDLNVITNTGPAAAAFNDFGPLFDSDGAQLTVSGVAGTNNTFGDEVVLSALTDRLSFSVGQFFSTTDGFRANDDLQNQVYDAYAQYAFSPKLNIQAEYRYRSTDQGDLVLNFDPDSFSRDDNRDVHQETYRLGARLSPMPDADVLFSYIHSDRDGDQNLVTTGPRIDEQNDETGDQFEGQVLFRRDAYSLIAGGGTYHVDVDREFAFDFSPAPCLIPTGCDVTSEFNRDQHNVYLYSHLALPAPVTWTLGAGYDWYEQRDLKIDKLSPKLGVQWDISDRLRLRAAAFETVKRDLIVGQTIEPTQIAGFNQFFDDLNGTKSRDYGIGLDARLTGQVYGGLEASWRDLDVPTFEGNSATSAKWDEELYRAYLYWTPLDQWSVSAELVWDGFKSANDEPNVNIPAEVDTFSVPVALRYFSPLGIFGQIGIAYVHQDVKRRASSTAPEGNDDFVVLDAALGYRLPQRRGILSLEATNLLDSGFDFQDDNYRSNEPRTPSYLPERTVLARFTVNF